MIPYNWCDDHIKAANENAEKFTQYRIRVAKSVVLTAKRNTGRKGFTWFRKGEKTIGYQSKSWDGKDIIVAFSGHDAYKTGNSFGWCQCPKSVFI